MTSHTVEVTSSLVSFASRMLAIAPATRRSLTRALLAAELLARGSLARTRRVSAFFIHHMSFLAYGPFLG